MTLITEDDLHAARARGYLLGKKATEELSGLEIEPIRAVNAKLVEALEVALTHCNELRAAWERGALSEHDTQGGTRSNRNVDAIITICIALDHAKAVGDGR